MDKTVKKFINYLSNCNKLDEKDLVNILYNSPGKINFSGIFDYADKQYEIDNIIRLLSTDSKEWNQYTEIFYDFDILSQYLLDSPLNTRESFYIILRLIRRNIETGLIDKEVEIFDPKQNKEYEFDKLTFVDAMDFIRQKEYKNLQSADENTLTDDQKAQKKELEEYASTCEIDGNHIIAQHKNIKNHYLNKMKSYDKNDAKIVINTLKDMKVKENLCDNIYEMIIYEIDKRKKTYVNSELFKLSQSSAQPTLSKKEYYELTQEVKSYIDIENKRITRYEYINESTKLYLVSLLKKLNYKDEQIKDILRMIDKENKKYKSSKSSAVEQYVTLHSKIKYYSDKGYCVEEFKELEDYFNEIIIDSKNSRFWQQSLKETLEKTLELIPNDYEYELQTAKIYIKK